MKRLKCLIPLLIMIVSLLVMPVNAYATEKDFGNYASDEDFSYDSNWQVEEEKPTSAQYTGSNSDSSDDSSWFSCDGCTMCSSKSEMKFWLLAILAAIIVIIVGVALSSLKDSIKRTIDYHCKPKKKKEPEPEDDANKLRPISEYLSVDSGFSPSDFKEKLSNLYIRMQDDWQDKDISELRPYLTDPFYAQMKRQLEQLRKDGQTNIIRRPAVLGTTLMGWRQDGGKDIIIAQLKTRFVNYIKDDATGAIVSGSEVSEKFMTYEWTLTRTTGVKTKTSAGVTTQTCPHCGAHVDVNQTAECQFCGSVITTDTFDWAIDNITALSQTTK